MDIFAKSTKPYTDQIFGTSGLRRQTSVFRQEHYLENIVQSIFDCLNNFEGQTLVIGSDGRYFTHEAIQIIIKMAIANQFGRIIVGQNGLLSTPATSYLIQKRQAFGGIILTASHNPGGKDGDFGLKYNTSDGGPAPVSYTEKFTERSQQIDRFWTIQSSEISLAEVGEKTYGTTVVEVVDSVADYAQYMQSIFDFEAITQLFKNGFTMCYDAMNAVTGPYAKYIFEQVLGAPDGTVINAEPLPDFGGCHPEPNLTYAKNLVDLANSDDAPDLCAASDGDGDRYMILGKKCFVHPADSLAIIAQHLHTIPFYKCKFVGVARSMPTSSAVDLVCRDLDKPCYQTPTGWKYFGDLLAHKKITLCGEESFGAGSSHVREKDGIWAILCWLNIIANTHKSPNQLTKSLWKKYGRIYNVSINYTTNDIESAKHLLESLITKIPVLVGQSKAGLKITKATVFNYTNPITEDIVPNQGILIDFENANYMMVRLSGTSSHGATLKLYLHHHDTDYTQDPQQACSPLMSASEELLEVEKYLGSAVDKMLT